MKIGDIIYYITKYTGIKYLVESYQRIVDDIRNFRPPSKSEKYLLSFNKTMTKLTEPILSKSKDYLTEAKNNIRKNKILSFDNYWFFSSKRLPLQLE